MFQFSVIHYFLFLFVGDYDDTPGCSESLWPFPNYNMKNSTIICLLLTALAVLMIVEKAEGERFCGKRLAQFVSTTCHLNGKVNLKGRKGKLIILKFVKYIPDMTISEKRQLCKYLLLDFVELRFNISYKENI